MNLQGQGSEGLPMSTHALGGSKLRPMMSAMAPLPRAESWLQMSHPLNFDDRGVSTVFIMIIMIMMIMMIGMIMKSPIFQLLFISFHLFFNLFISFPTCISPHFPRPRRPRRQWLEVSAPDPGGWSSLRRPLCLRSRRSGASPRRKAASFWRIFGHKNPDFFTHRINPGLVSPTAKFFGKMWKQHETTATWQGAQLHFQPMQCPTVCVRVRVVRRRWRSTPQMHSWSGNKTTSSLCGTWNQPRTLHWLNQPKTRTRPSSNLEPPPEPLEPARNPHRKLHRTLSGLRPLS